MRKIFLVFGIIVFCFFLTGAYTVFAQEETVSNTQQSETVSNVEQGETGSDTNWKQELDSGKQQIQEQKQGNLQNAQAARVEEDQLRQQIKAAMNAGDMKVAGRLREQLKSIHQENLQEKAQDMQNMQAAKQELQSNVQEARQADNLPSGPQGETGTNVGNPPGSKGGPGVGVDRRPGFDKDNNPPGAKGGPGTNWENKPGPMGGPGAGPDRRPGMNSSGSQGGPGIGADRRPGMGNPSGAKGGPGATPNRAGSQGGTGGQRGGGKSR